jgi:hypothetical protein
MPTSDQDAAPRSAARKTAEAVWDAPNWKEASREYHNNRPRHDPNDPRIARARRLLADDVSIERAWHQLNRCNEAAPMTLEALVYELRTYGALQLARPNCQRRLAALSTAQVREIIARLIRIRPRYPAITDDLLLALGEQIS